MKKIIITLLILCITSIPIHADEVKKSENEYFTNGIQLLTQKKFNEAILCYEKAIKVTPKDSKESLGLYNRMIGDAYLMKQEYRKSVKYYQKSIEYVPNVIGYESLGMAHTLLLQYSLAEKAYNNALLSYKKDPGKLDESHLINAYMGKGTSLQGQNKHEEAIKCFDYIIGFKSKATKTNVYKASGYYYKSLSLISLNKITEGINSLSKALVINPQLRNKLSQFKEFDKVKNNPSFKALLKNK